jgi:hypothetical protein
MGEWSTAHPILLRITTQIVHLISVVLNQYKAINKVDGLEHVLPIMGTPIAPHASSYLPIDYTSPIIKVEAWLRRASTPVSGGVY